MYKYNICDRFIVYIRDVVQGPGYLLSYLFISGIILTRLRRPLTKMTIKERQFEGEYRFINSRLIANSEEIAFYNGNKKEKKTIEMIYERLVNLINYIIKFNKVH